MKSFSMLKIPMLLLGFGGALLLSPSCKAQEVNPDHFTASGVQDVYEPPAGKATAPAVKQKSPALQSRKLQTDPAATLQVASKRSASVPLQPGPQPVVEKRKLTPSEPKKP